MSYYLYSYQALNGIGSGAIIVFEPYRFSSLDEANNYASILRVLKHSEFYTIDEDSMRDNFSNVLCDEVQVNCS